MIGLSVKTLEVAYEIQKYIMKKNQSPTISEIGRLTNLKTRNSVYLYLNRLKEAGIVTWQAGETRTIQVIKTEYVISEYEKMVKKVKNDYIYK